MRYRPLVALIAFFCAALLFALPASSVPLAKSYEFSPFVGYTWFDSDMNLDDDFTLGGRFGYFYTDNWEVEAALFATPTEDDVGENADVVTTQLDLLYNFDLGKWVPYFAGGLGYSDYAADGEFIADFGGGVRYFITDNIALRGDLREMYVFDDSRWNFMASLGISFILGSQVEELASQETSVAQEPEKAEPSPADTDGDGVVDGKDKCPDTPKGAKVDGRGCPIDSDGDGLTDLEETNKYRTNPTNADTDADGLSDGEEVRKHRTDPNKADTDGDTLTDGDEVAKYRTNPINPDTDGGGVNDGVEINLSKTDPRNKADDSAKELVKIELEVLFDVNKADIKPEYEKQIDAVGVLLKKYKDINVTIEGHTDSDGAAEYNRRLSQQRSESIVNYLVKHHSIDPKRLTSVGYGEDKPIASNDTAEGKAKNRRVYASVTSE